MPGWSFHINVPAVADARTLVICHISRPIWSKCSILPAAGILFGYFWWMLSRCLYSCIVRGKANMACIERRKQRWCAVLRMTVGSALRSSTVFVCKRKNKKNRVLGIPIELWQPCQNPEVRKRERWIYFRVRDRIQSIGCVCDEAASQTLGGGWSCLPASKSIGEAFA